MLHVAQALSKRLLMQHSACPTFRREIHDVAGQFPLFRSTFCRPCFHVTCLNHLPPKKRGRSNVESVPQGVQLWNEKAGIHNIQFVQVAFVSRSWLVVILYRGLLLTRHNMFSLNKKRKFTQKN